MKTHYKIYHFFSIIETITLLEETKIIKMAPFNHVTNICYVNRYQYYW